MSKKSEDTPSVSPMATGVDPSIRAILDAMQKQNEIKLRELLKETIIAATSRSYQGSLVSNNLNKSLEKTDVTVGNEEMLNRIPERVCETKDRRYCKSKQKVRDNAYNNEHLLIEEDQMMTAKNACDTTESKTSADLMSRNLDANTQEKSLENKDDKNPSPSMLDSTSDSDRYKSVENDNAVTGVIATDEAKHRGRSRRSDKVEVKKDEDTRKILQNEKGGLEEQRKLEEDTKEETAETEVNSKGILNNKCDLLDTERAIEINDTVQDIKFTEGRSRTQNDMEDVVEDSQELSNKTIEDLHQMLKHQSEIHKVTLNEASLKIGELSDKIKCFKGKDSQIPKRNELLEEEQNKWRSLEKMITEKLEEEKSQCSVSMCTKNASNVTITFRTPQAPRKHNQDQTRSSSKVKLRELITANDQKLNYDPEHQLADLQVECSDKDRTTQEFEKHTEDMKEEEKKHQEELGDIIKLHDEEKYKLIQHWCSVECQTAIKGYIDGKVHKESSETESIKNAAINEVEQEIINKDPQIDDQYKKKKDEKFQEEQAENTTEIVDHSRYAGDTSLDKESTNDVEIFNTNEGEQNIEKHNVCTVLNIDTVNVTNAQCQALIKTLGETFDDKAQTLHVTDTDTDLSKLVDSSSEVMTRNDSITPITSGVISDLETADDIDIKEKNNKKQQMEMDIFDDWGIENAEDDSQSVSKAPDTVEIELKSLLNDTKTRTIEESTVVLVEEEITCMEKEPVVDAEKALEVAKQNKEMQVSKEQLDNNQTIKKQQDSIKPLLKDH
ncbi:reticulocyte-binding protein 2 homolog a-like [Bombus vosnesenskii]|uniref:Reticulocyte-binding protein 2 homolog a-like n=1 Tax=Bombus vosnesenskii TaxID=207650 RepID=A0A6J3LBY3_9HYME|nr:reticulocyte-binding protein 2 homolog a-like [Bombus vosnesenskii]